MSKSVKHILTTLALLVIFYAAASVVATLVQLADAADRVRMGAGQYVFWSLLAVLAALAASPFVLYFRLPKPLQPPETRDEPGYSQYLTQVLAECSATRTSPVPRSQPPKTSRPRCACSRTRSTRRR